MVSFFSSFFFPSPAVVETAMGFSFSMAAEFFTSGTESPFLLTAIEVPAFKAGFVVVVSRGRGCFAFFGSKPGGGMGEPLAPVVAASVPICRCDARIMIAGRDRAI